MNSRLNLEIAAVVAVLAIAFGGAGSAVEAVDGGSISGTVYFDNNLNGQRDPGDPPATGIEIVALRNGLQVGVVESGSDSGPAGRSSLPWAAAAVAAMGVGGMAFALLRRSR